MVELPDIPKNTDLEDYVAALFQMSGYYVEKNIEEAVPGTPILELDVVATRYAQTGRNVHLAEVKSGDWGFGDLFKVRGQMHYLSIASGALFSSKSRPDKQHDVLREKATALGIAYVFLPEEELSREAPTFESDILQPVTDANMFAVWRFSNKLERILHSEVVAHAKSNHAKSGALAVREYLYLVKNETFFENDVRKRASAFYESYQNHPKLTAGLSWELDGREFDGKSPQTNSPRIDKCLRYGGETLLQACMYLEHKARLSLLKSVVDYIHDKSEGNLRNWKLGNLVIDWFNWLPETFRTAVSHLSTQPDFVRYPVFWQVFLWGWGGFYLKSRQEEEFALLSKQTGVRESEIPHALKAFDVLFPTPNSWLYDDANSDIVWTKMMPMSFEGIGAFQRKLRYKLESYGDLGGRGFTANDLARWHQDGYHRLSGN